MIFRENGIAIRNKIITLLPIDEYITLKNKIMKKFFIVLAVTTLAIVAPAQVSANESNSRVSSEQGSENIKQKAQEFIVRIYELALLEDKAGLQNLQKEMMAYAASLSEADQGAFLKACDEYTARVEKIGEKVVYLTDKLLAAYTLNDQSVNKSIEKEVYDYVNSLSESDQAIFERLSVAYSTKLASSK